MEINFSYYLLLGLLLSLSLNSKLLKIIIGPTIVFWLLLLSWSTNNLSFFSNRALTWSAHYHILFSYNFDALSKLFVMIISFIGIFIFTYAFFYDKNIIKRKKLLSLLNLFAISMVGTVCSDNMITFFLFWETTGIVSYFLIQFNRQDSSSNQAAFNSLFLAMVSGLSMLVGFILINQYFSTWSLTAFNNIVVLKDNVQITSAIFWCVVIAAMIKSAQFPFHFWLPGAMKAPTPVSAYLHSATMVNLGIYILARLHIIFSQLSIWYPVLSSIGILTMLLASFVSFKQNDLKKLLAYTTLFILGSLFYLLGGTHWQSAEAIVILLIFHALYKSAAFLTVGMFDKIYKTRNLKELQGIGKSNWKFLICIVIPFAAMAGLPPLFGFIVKEIIYESKLSSPNFSWLYTLISLITSMLIAAASIKVFFYLVVKKPLGLTPQHKDNLSWILLILCVAIISFATLVNLFKTVIIQAGNTIIPINHIQYLDPNSYLSTLLSLISITGGVIIFIFYELVKLPNIKITINASHLFESILNKMLTLGKTVALALEYRRLNFYIKLMLLTFALLLIPALEKLHFLNLKNLTPQEPGQIICLAIISLGALSLLMTRRVLLNLISLSVFGLLLSFYFILSGAVDVAMTQAIVEILSVIIIVFSIRYFSYTNRKTNRDSFISRFSLSFIVGSIFLLIGRYNLSLPFDNYLGNFYKANSLDLAYGKNIVNVILVDFRAFDTFGEVLVVLGAGLTVYALLCSKSFRNK